MYFTTELKKPYPGISVPSRSFLFFFWLRSGSFFAIFRLRANRCTTLLDGKTLTSTGVPHSYMVKHMLQTTEHRWKNTATKSTIKSAFEKLKQKQLMLNTPLQRSRINRKISNKLTRNPARRQVLYATCFQQNKLHYDLELWPLTPEIWRNHLHPIMHHWHKCGENTSNTFLISY